MRKYELKINNKTFNIQVKDFNSDEAELVVNGKPYLVEVSGIESAVKSAPKRPLPTSAPQSAAPKSAPKPAGTGGDAVTAPIPGKIMEVFVKEGDTVKAGQPVLKMEAMKMENVINSPQDGTIGSILANEGDAVNQGQELILLG